MDFLIKKGADVNAKDSHGRMPIMIAASPSWPHWPRLDMVKAFLDAGADINITDNYGKSVLNLASDPKIVKLISATNQTK